MQLPQFQTIALPEILTILATIGLLWICINYLMYYLPTGTLKHTHLISTPQFDPISVIICARNEDDNLTEFLPKVLTQDYPNFEVIVVNDCSDDNTEHVIDEYIKIFPNLRKANIKEDGYYKHGKKFALLVGIKAAQNENLVMTDADCYPSTNQWLKEIAMGFATNKEIILGYGAYEKTTGFLNKLIRFDTFTIALLYFSAAIKGKAYMGVGRNLAYKKNLFFKHKGFSTHYHINSGDDDLFVNQAATSQNVNIAVHENCITYSKPKTTFGNWRRQKQRHLTTAPHYKPHAKTRITNHFLAQYFFWLAFAALAINMQTLLLMPIILLIKVVFQVLVMRKAAIRLNELDLWGFSFVYELFLLFVYPIFHIGKLLYKPKKWAN
jgi:poly-beta-1,6-N-acetyl-D-glucosamine synthase